MQQYKDHTEHTLDTSYLVVMSHGMPISSEENWLDLTRYSKICHTWQHLMPQSSNDNNVAQIFSITEKWKRLEWVWLYDWEQCYHCDDWQITKKIIIHCNTSQLKSDKMHQHWWLQDALITMISTSLIPSTSIIRNEILILTADVWDGVTGEFFPEWHLQRKAWIIHKGWLIHGVGGFSLMARFREIL